MNFNITDYITPETITAFISAFLAYLGSKHILSPNIDKKLYKNSFAKAYLPLHKIFYICKQTNSEDKIKEILNDSQTKKTINKILTDKCEYLTSGLAENINNLMVNINENNFSMQDFNKTYFHIKEDYEQIKRALGYPYLPFSRNFFRKDNKGRLEIISNFFYIFGTFLMYFLSIFIFIFIILTIGKTTLRVTIVSIILELFLFIILHILDKVRY